MSVQTTMVNAVDSAGKWLYRAGGLAALVFGIAYIVIMALYFPLGGKPTGAEAWLASTAANTTTWWAILWLSVLTDFLLVPVALALYLALKGISNNAMLVATAFVGLFVFLDLALTWINIAVLITLSGNYAVAASDAQRAVFVTAAMYPSTVANSNLVFVYNTLTLSVGILVTGFVMLRGVFNKVTAYVGVATGFLGIVSVVSSFFAGSLSGLTIIIASVLTMVWGLLVGYRLLRLGRR